MGIRHIVVVAPKPQIH